MRRLSNTSGIEWHETEENQTGDSDSASPHTPISAMEATGDIEEQVEFIDPPEDLSEFLDPADLLSVADQALSSLFTERDLTVLQRLVRANQAVGDLEI